MNEKVFELIANISEQDSIEIDESTLFSDIPEWDSLKSISLISSIEMELGVSIPMSKIYKIETVKDLLNAIKNI